MTETEAETDAETQEERLFSGYAGRLLVVTSVGWMMIQTGRMVISPMLPTIIDALAITPLKAGIGLTTMWGLYALNQYPSGRLSDTLSRKTLIIAGLCFQLLGFGLFAVAVTFPVYLLASAIVGIGSGLYPTPARALISDHFVEKRGQAFGFHQSLGDIGGLLASGLAVVVLAVAVWHVAFVPVVGVLAVVALFIHRWSHEPYTRLAVDRETVGAGASEAFETIRRLLSGWRFRFILLAYALFSFSWQSSIGFLPTFLQEAKGFSPELASAGFAVMFVIGALVKPVSGYLGDRLHKALVASVSLLFGAMSLTFVVFTPEKALAMVGVVGFAIGLLAYPPVMQAYLMDSFPEASMGGDLGALRTIYITFGSLGPTFTGYVAGRASYTLAFTGLVVCLFLSTTLTLVSTQVSN